MASTLGRWGKFGWPSQRIGLTGAWNRISEGRWISGWQAYINKTNGRIVSFTPIGGEIRGNFWYSLVLVSHQMNHWEFRFEGHDIFFWKEAKIVFMFDFTHKRHIHFIVFHRGYNPRNGLMNFQWKAFIPFDVTQAIWDNSPGGEDLSGL